MNNDVIQLSKLQRYDRRFIRRMLISLLLSLGSILALLFATSLVQRAQTSRESDAATLVSIGGHQRVLSQRIALLSLASVNIQSDSVREKTKKVLREEIDEMEKSHQALQSGNPELGVSSEKSAKVREIFFGDEFSLDRKLHEFIDTARAFLSSDTKDLTVQNPKLLQLTEMSTGLMGLFEKLIAQYRTEGVEGIHGLEKLTLQMLFIEVIAILGIALFIFIPILRRLEKEFYERSIVQQELLEQNSELEQFAATVAHDLKAPLNNIGGFSQFLRSRLANQEDKDTNEILEFIEAGVLRMTKMINELLQYARVSRKDRVLENISLSELLKKTLKDFEVQINECNARIDLQTVPSVIGDRLQLEHLFQNLVSNALKYKHPERTPHITIRSFNVSSPDGSMVAVVVEDNGRGFPEGTEKKMFEPFRRLDPQEAIEGSGFGLALCRKIARRHHGTITAERVTSGGARFTVMLRA